MLARQIFLIASFLVFGVRQAVAQDAAPFVVKVDGSRYQANFTENEQKIRRLPIYFESLGNSSTAVAVNLEGPQGAKIYAVHGLLGSRSPASALSDPAFGTAASFRTQASKRDVAQVSIVGSSGTSSMGSLYSWFHLNKDACSGNKSTKYLSKITIDLSEVPTEAFTQGFSLVVSVQEFRFKGAQVASIKPASDGLYKNEPILLMGTISYNNEYVNINRWSGGKPRFFKRIPVVKYVGYRGYGLSLARLKGLLNGGSATFELTNGGDIYGVCFKLQRTRQAVNGYPAPR